MTALLGDGFAPDVVDISIQDGLISDIVPTTTTHVDAGSGGEPSRAEIDGAGLLATPGMVDAHDHLRLLTPGLATLEGLGLEAFLKASWAMQGAMGPEEYRLGALLGCVQRLKTGITTIADHCYPFHASGLDDASVSGYEASGARWLYARGIMTRPYPPVDEPWELAEDRIRKLVHGGRVPTEHMFVAPVSIRQATPDDFRRSRDLADELGCGLYTHVAETPGERATWQQECGAPPIHALDALGFLTPRTILVHCIVLEDDEISLIAERGANVIHCPTNNMKLAKGFTRVPDLLAAGVNVGMGIDMMADMLVEMRTEIGMQAALTHDPNAVTRPRVLQMATSAGAQALGFGGRTGTLAPGMAADIVLFDARSISQAPMMDPVHALIYATDGGMVRHVLVRGDLVVENGRSTLVDESQLILEAEDVAASYLKRLGSAEVPWHLRR